MSNGYETGRFARAHDLQCAWSLPAAAQVAAQVACRKSFASVGSLGIAAVERRHG